MNWILVVMISTQFNTSIDFQLLSSKDKCESLSSEIKLTIKDAVTLCRPQ